MPARSAAARRSNRRSHSSPRRRLDRTDAAEGGLDMAASPRKGKRWSQRVTQTSDALDLEKRVFAKEDPQHRPLAQALGRAEHSTQKQSVSLGDVDADLLPQSGGKDAAQSAARAAGGG